MKIIYTTQDERNSIISDKKSEGLILVEDAILENEKYLIFAEPAPPTDQERIEELEAIVADLLAEKLGVE